jgi:SAM-dependent methyltransferase
MVTVVRRPCRKRPSVPGSGFGPCILARDLTDGAYTPQAVTERVARAARSRGARPVVGDFARWGTGLVAGLPWTLRGSRGEFTFGGERYPYRFHPYKWSWLTERAVEVPIVQAIVDRHAGKRILEVGNVLSHYRPQSHLIVDKYEQQPGVINRDVLDLDDLGPFDLVVAISTIEHVGWDEEPRDASKAPEAVRRLQALLAPGGQLVLTVPIGYHPGLDASLRTGAFQFTRAAALRRVGQTRWSEVSPDEVWNVPYDFLLYSARAVFVGRIERAPAE